jgi:phosphate transport system permease protein
MASITPPARISVASITPEHLLHLALAAIGGLSLASLISFRMLPVHGALGFVPVAYLCFLALYAAVSATALDRVGVIDRVVGALVATSGFILVGTLAGIVFFTLIRGWESLHHLNFFTQTTAFIGPDAALDKGGILAAMVGTLEQVLISVVISVPLGVATAVYLNEVGGRLATVVSTVVEAMTAVPTIVAGLFIYSMLVLRHHLDPSGFAASLALCVSMIPVVTKTAEVVLRLVPGGLREASLALGVSQWETVWRVVLPTARPGLVTAVLLGVARVIGETSPILIVSGTTNELNADPLHGAQVSLPLFIFNQARMPLDTAVARAFGAAVVLLFLIVFLFSVARIVGGRAPGHISRRKLRRVSASIAARYRESEKSA